MTTIDHINADIVRSDLKNLIKETIIERHGDQAIDDYWDSWFDEMTTNELWATADEFGVL